MADLDLTADASTCAPDPHVWVAHMRGGEPIHVETCMGCGQFNWDGLREQVAAIAEQVRQATADTIIAAVEQRAVTWATSEGWITVRDVVAIARRAGDGDGTATI